MILCSPVMFHLWLVRHLCRHFGFIITYFHGIAKRKSEAEKTAGYWSASTGGLMTERAKLSSSLISLQSSSADVRKPDIPAEPSCR